MDRQQTLNIDNRYRVQLDVFEGPLDLLLHLIGKHEIDIFDIPIAFVTQKYIEYLDVMQQLNLDLASEYLEMAAQLALIKSRMMLPKDASQSDDDALDDDVDPREELVRQLLEYQKYRTAAESLSERPQAGRDVFYRPPDPGEVAPERPLDPPGLFALMDALRQVFERLELDENASEREISITRISVTARIHQILDHLRVVKHVPFMELFVDHVRRTDIVTTFLAILEMTRLGLTRIHQAAPGAEIHITAAADIDDADRVLSENPVEEA
ncbi:MAG: segregation/condensation protein A [Myxococcales bacterium]|nr:segregation/condensation protein A [Myxococcales bacterium]